MVRHRLRVAALFAFALASSLAMGQSHGPAKAPAVAKAAHVEAFRLAVAAEPVRIRLEAPDPAAIESLRLANAQSTSKRLEIGIGRDVDSIPGARWQALPDGHAAHWQVTSAGAQALRVALATSGLGAGAQVRFAGSGDPDLVHGPFDAESLKAAGNWSPVLKGETATIEVFVPGGRDAPGIAIEKVSHLFVNPADPKADIAAKAALSCAVNFICRAAVDPALADAGSAVARMTFTSASGSSVSCTGTLLGSSDNSFQPYFFSAAHCLSTQAVANTVVTYWFYETVACNGTATRPSAMQVSGGARVLYANVDSDVLFLRLNVRPPAGATYAGWDAARLTTGTAVTGVHHPQGDVKKVSLGSIAGFARSVIVDGIATRVQWNSAATGFTEQGSSGSGIFSGNASTGYRFRGGLQGGPSASCSSPPSELFDTYSRFDLAYPYIAQYLNPSGAPALAANVVVNPGFEGGTGSWTQSSSASAAIIRNDPSTAHSGSWYAWLGGSDNLTDTLVQTLTIPSGAARMQFWYRIATNETSSTGSFDRLTVTVSNAATGVALGTLATLSNLDATSGWVQSAVYDLSPFAGQSVRLQFRATTDFSDPTSFRIDDITMNGLAAAAPANATSLWWNPQESGWGLNVNEQGDVAFATLFTYDASGAPLWLVASRADRQKGASSFVGTLYRTTGPPFNANPFPPIGPGNLTAVGNMAIDFSASPAMLGYTVDDTYVSKIIERQVFGTRAATCVPTTASRAGATNYQDLWWNPAESGWGLNITQQGQVLFATLFTYGANNQGTWLFMSRGERQADNSYLGDLFRATGPAFDSSPWRSITSTRVGTMRLRFANGDSATLEYSVDGTSVTKAISRQVFSSPVPLCTS